jgi:hypothetical protein
MEKVQSDAYFPSGNRPLETSTSTTIKGALTSRMRLICPINQSVKVCGNGSQILTCCFIHSGTEENVSGYRK